jgi:hypothetical protein
MRYDFTVFDGWVKPTHGQVEGNEPRIAILNAVRASTDVLDETRVDDGRFEADVETHGLGDIHVRIARAD